MFYLLQPSEDDSEIFKDKAAEFLLHWGAFGGLLMRELTLQNASSFGMIFFCQTSGAYEPFLNVIWYVKTRSLSKQMKTINVNFIN